MKPYRAPRAPIVTNRSVQFQQLWTQVPVDVFCAFDRISRDRQLARSVILRRIVEAVCADRKMLDKLIGKEIKS